MHSIIIATLYSYEPVISSVTKFGAKKLVILIDKNPNEYQKKSLKEVHNALGKYIEIEIIKTDVYDIYTIAKTVVNFIDKLNDSSKILLNVSAARKPKAFGLMFAGYARYNRIEKIFYITKEKNDLVILPKISFNLNNSEKKILNFLIENRNIIHLKEIYFSLNISKSMFYKTFNDLTNKGFICNKDITQAGRIALL